RLLVGVHHVDADAAATNARDQRAQCGRGAATTADDLPEIVGVYVHLDGAAATTGHHVDPDIVGVVHDPADQVLDGVNDGRAHGRGQLSVDSADSACSAASTGASASAGASASTGASASAGASPSAGASASAVSAAFLAGAFFFLAVVASVLGPPSAWASAALNRSSLLGVGSLTFSVPCA